MYAPEKLAKEFDPARLSTKFFGNPYPVCQALQAFEPAHVCPDGSVFITRYRDLKRVYRDARGFLQTSEASLEKSTQPPHCLNITPRIDLFQRYSRGGDQQSAGCPTGRKSVFKNLVLL